MGKGDLKSKRGKITAGSYGKTRKRKSASIRHVEVNVLDKNNEKAEKTDVRKEVGFPVGESQNAEVKSAPKEKATKPAAKKPETKAESKTAKPKETAEAKPKAAKPKKTEE